MPSPVRTIFLLVAATTLVVAELPPQVAIQAKAVTEKCIAENNIDEVKYAESLFHEAMPIPALKELYRCLLHNFGMLDSNGKVTLPDNYENRELHQGCIDNLPETYDHAENAYLAKLCVWHVMEDLKKPQPPKKSFIDKLKEFLKRN